MPLTSPQTLPILPLEFYVFASVFASLLGGTLPVLAQTPPPEPLPLESSGNGSTEPIASPESDSQAALGDPELGVLRLQLRSEEPASTSSFPNVAVFLQGNTGYSSNSNILSSLDPVNDRIFRAGLGVTVVPQFSPKTLGIVHLEESWIRYDRFHDLNFSQFQSQLKLRHALSSQFSTEMGWTHEQFVDSGSGNQFLQNDTLQTAIVHQKNINDRLNFTSFLQTQYTFANPNDRSQFSNQIGTNLSYQISKQLEAGFNYRFDINLFTQQDRLDLYHQAIGSLSWKFAKYSRISLFSGVTFGNSSRSNLDFNGFLFGVGIESGIKLF